MKHIFVFDPKAFINQDWKVDVILDTIGEFFRTQDKPDFSIHYSRYRRNALMIINDEVQKVRPGDVIRVYAIGGNEILFDCLNGVALFPDIELAMIPHTGTNDFLRIFGKEKFESFRDIMGTINYGTLATDAIRWGVNYALNSCYIGMDSAFLKRLKNMRENLGSKSFFILSKILYFINFIYSAFDKKVYAKGYRIFIDDADYSGQYSLIHIANGPYFSGKVSGAKDATPNDGLLDVTLIRSSHFLGTISALRKYSSGKKPKNSVSFLAKKIMIESDSEMWIQLDNEYILDTNITLNVVPQAVNIAAAKDLSYPLASIPAI